MSYAQYRRLRTLFPGASLKPTTDIVEDVALVKDREEIASLRAAVAISDRVFEQVLKNIRPGVTEREVSAEISYWHKSYGAENDAFEPIVASGKRGALPHARATTKKIASRELVTLDFGCVVNGYHSDITRTIGIGSVGRKGRDVYSVVLDAQTAAIASAHSGMRVDDLDATARNVIRKRGYGRYFTHSLGHGIGLSIHERPRISRLGKEYLHEGSVVTIEPGIYIPGYGGVRIEDDILLTSRGCEVLNAASKEFIAL